MSKDNKKLTDQDVAKWFEQQRKAQEKVQPTSKEKKK